MTFAATRHLAPDYAQGTLRDVLPGCFAALGLPGVVDRLGLAEQLAGARRIAVLLVDGMGYQQLPMMAPVAPGLSTLATRKTTCGFPSTTPTSLVSLATGEAPGAHGILAFTTRVPGTDRVLNHTQWTDDPSPESWQPVPPLYVAAAAHGIDVAVVNRPEYVGSGLTEVTARGARYVPASGATELAIAMSAELRNGKSPKLVYGYHPELDKAGHAHGVESTQWLAAASEVDTLVAALVAGLPEGAALVVTADHGQLNVPFDRRLDIDDDPRLAAGVRIFAGEPRVRYLHTEAGAQEDVLATWRELAGHAAWIGARDEAVATNWYGQMDLTFMPRLGSSARTTGRCSGPNGSISTSPSWSPCTGR